VTGEASAEGVFDWREEEEGNAAAMDKVDLAGSLCFVPPFECV